ncbi:MAG: hypothetical protein PHR16_06160 [Methylovulum sp.]|nr:hypothetical protein [Methylovulum sp.]
MNDIVKEAGLPREYLDKDTLDGLVMAVMGQVLRPMSINRCLTHYTSVHG